MKLYRFGTTVIIISTILFTWSSLIAQEVTNPDSGMEGNGSPEATPNQPDQDTSSSAETASDVPGSQAAMKDLNISPAYFMRHDAYRYAQEFKRKSRDEVIQLKRLVDFYGDKAPETKDRYIDIQSEYRKGMQFYYMGQYESSIQSLEKTRRDAKNLFLVFVKLYDQDTQEILDECSNSMVEKDITMAYNGGGSGSASAEFVKYQMKLRMAFQQFSQAKRNVREEQYESAIDHYRLAKLHAINIILDLTDEESKKKELSKKYRTDLIDAYGVQAPPTAN